LKIGLSGINLISNAVCGRVLLMDHLFTFSMQLVTYRACVKSLTRALGQYGSLIFSPVVLLKVIKNNYLW